MKLANQLDINRVVMMSGLPGGPGDKNPNWIITASPKENAKILDWQWNEVAIPYWTNLYNFALNNGITRISLENHGMQLVHNVETFFRLKNLIGDAIGLNFDPSHYFWMGGDPLSVIPTLGNNIYHVHAKDTKIEKLACVNTLLEPKSYDEYNTRSWNYCTLGNGHDQQWWFDFIKLLKKSGYNDVLSIEHGDRKLPNEIGLTKAINLLKKII
jgi:sugar phosphate isomerase/epimerase